jgi:hypothetical protein
VLSIALVMIDTGPSSSTISKERQAALRVIEEEYFGKAEQGPLAPYQVQLRAAWQARCRGDHKAERRCYGKVLELLRGEPLGGASSLSKQLVGFERGVSGSRGRDRRLEECIITLLNGSSEDTPD